MRRPLTRPRQVAVAGAAIAALLALLALPGAAGATPAVEDGGNGNRRCERRFEEAQRIDMESFRDFDRETWRDAHAEDAVTILTSGTVIEGRDAIVNALSAHFDNREAVWSWTELSRRVEGCKTAHILYETVYEIERIGLRIHALTGVSYTYEHGRWLSVADQGTVLPGEWWYNPGVRSGFVTMVGRPNVGKSSLVNAICGEKVSIVSDKPQTTRHRVRGVLTRPDAQVVFVDTPGLHKPVTALGRKVNATAIESVGASDAVIDVVCLVLDAMAPFGDGDRWVAGHLDLPRSVVVVNKTDRASRQRVLAQLAAAAELGAESYFPVSARTGDGVPALVDHLVARLPEGPAFFPDDTVRDGPEEQWVAELVREQLLAVTRDELPYSIATRVSEWEGNRITVEIIVERESQKGMVIGRGGHVLKQVGERARAQLPEGTFLALRVKVDKDWQRRPDRVDRLY